MKWSEVRQHFPSQWLLVEATRAHSENNHRILEDLAVIATFATGQSAMDSYADLHEKAPDRELYVLHTDREELEIEELRWMGIRGAWHSWSEDGNGTGVAGQRLSVTGLFNDGFESGDTAFWSGVSGAAP